MLQLLLGLLLVDHHHHHPSRRPLQNHPATSQVTIMDLLHFAGDPEPIQMCFEQQSRMPWHVATNFRVLLQSCHARPVGRGDNPSLVVSSLYPFSFHQEMESKVESEADGMMVRRPHGALGSLRSLGWELWRQRQMHQPKQVAVLTLGNDPHPAADPEELPRF